MNSEGPLLEARNLRVSFRVKGKNGTRLIPVLRGLGFSLVKGRPLGLIGESGSGKSVLAAALTRLLPNTALVSGEVFFQGREIMGLPEKRFRQFRGRRIGLVHQNPELALNPLIPLGKQITEGSRIRGDRPREARDRGLALLARLGLADPEKIFRSYPHQLSGGMNQRALIAAAAATGPQALIVDEPSTGLDEKAKAEVAEELELLRKNSAAELLVISHDLPFVKRLCSFCAVLYAGEFVEAGETAALLTNPLHPYLRLLLGALPEGGFVPIPGPVYSPADPPAGCAFAPRCPQARGDCAGEAPPEVTVPRSDRMVRCRLYI